MSDVTASLDLVSLFLKIWEWVKQQHQRVAEAPTSSDSYNTPNLWQPTKPPPHLSFLQTHSITPTKKCHQSSLFVWLWWPGQCQCGDHGKPIELKNVKLKESVLRDADIPLRWDWILMSRCQVTMIPLSRSWEHSRVLSSSSLVFFVGSRKRIVNRKCIVI